MATIENEAERIGVAVREAMIEDVLPIVQERPAAIVGEREPVGLGWLRDLPDFRDYTSRRREDRAAPRGDRHRAAPGHRGAGEGRPAGVLLAGRGPGLAGLVHRQRGRRDGRVLRAARVRQVHRRVAAVPLQGDARPAPLDGRHGRVPALDDRRACAVRRAARGVLAVQRHDASTTSRPRSASRSRTTSGRSRTSASTTRRPSRRRAAHEDQGRASSAGLPCVFGFTVYSSIAQAATTGRIPFPGNGREGRSAGTRCSWSATTTTLTITNTTSGARRRRARCSSATRGARAGATTATARFPTTTSCNKLAVDFWSLTKAGLDRHRRLQGVGRATRRLRAVAQPPRVRYLSAFGFGFGCAATGATAASVSCAQRSLKPAMKLSTTSASRCCESV